MHPALTAEQQGVLAELAESANQELEEAGAVGATHAFNLGCSATLIPGLLLVVLIFLFTQANWVIAGTTLVLVVMAVLGFANFAAFVARKRRMERVYELNVSPTIERTIKAMNVDRPAFDQLAGAVLPENAVLREYLAAPPLTESQDL